MPSTEGGQFVWLEQLDSRNGSGRAIGTFDDGSVAIAGVYFDWLSFDGAEPSAATFSHESGTISRAFVAKYDSEQRLLWANDTEPQGGAYSRALAVRSDGSVAVSGNFSDGAFTLGPGSPNEMTLPGVDGTDAFLAMYGADGRFEWAVSAASSDNETFSEIAVLPDDSLIVVGNDEGTQPGVTTVFARGTEGETSLATRGGFIARYSRAGDLMWAQSTGGRTAWDVALAPDGHILVLGYFFDSAVIGQGQEREKTLYSAGARDIYLASYDVDGTLLSVHQYGAETNDQPTDLAVGPDGAIWMSTGSSTTPADESASRTYFSSLVRLDSEGAIEWLQTQEGSLTYRGEMVTLSDGSCVMASRLEEPLTLEVLGKGPVTFTADDEANLLLRRYAPGGELLWAKRGGGVGRDQDAVDGIAAFTDDTIVVVGGLFLGPALFGEGEAGEFRFAVEEARVPFFAKFRP